MNLRDVTAADLPILFAQEADPAAVWMAAFTPADPTDHAAFTAHWTRVLADPTVVMKAIVVDGAVAGSIGCYPQEGLLEVTYWIGRAFWGRGIATQAARALIADLDPQPLRARVAKDNTASLRVLQKCGFEVVGDDRGFAHGRGEEIDEFVLVRPQPT